MGGSLAERYTIKSGDTLWDLAHARYGTGTGWKQIYDLNKMLIADPHWIYPGQDIAIPLELPSQTASVSAVHRYYAR